MTELTENVIFLSWQGVDVGEVVSSVVGLVVFLFCSILLRSYALQATGEQRGMNMILR